MSDISEDVGAVGLRAAVEHTLGLLDTVEAVADRTRQTLYNISGALTPFPMADRRWIVKDNGAWSKQAAGDLVLAAAKVLAACEAIENVTLMYATRQPRSPNTTEDTL